MSLTKASSPARSRSGTPRERFRCCVAGRRLTRNALCVVTAFGRCPDTICLPSAEPETEIWLKAGRARAHQTSSLKVSLTGEYWLFIISLLLSLGRAEVGELAWYRGNSAIRQILF